MSAMDTEHQEVHFEDYIVGQLAQRGWVVGDTSGYDQNYALYPEDLAAWLRATQPKSSEKLVAAHGAGAPEVLMARLATVLAKEGTVDVLRRGIKLAGVGPISLSEKMPEDERDPTAWERYRANILRVVRQLKYRPGSNLAIDLAFFINGIPVATVELKTDFTQSVEAAMEQYKTDRLPKDVATGRIEPLLTFKRGAVVHFAMSDSDIRMTTRLDGKNTFFLPFNRGHDGHAGNPVRTDGEYPVAYFWKEICERNAWLRIFQSFVYTERKDVVDLAGNHCKKETLIFPRFHQWDAVTRMLADAKAAGPGRQYLCEHSAGSGKTSTIAWVAHGLTRLRTKEGESLFHSVIVVTDRTVLDRQLQDAIQQIDHQAGMIAAIGESNSGKSKSAALAVALEQQTPIVVVTIQTFPYAMEQILTNGKLRGLNFAVIIDEAHTSQTGTAASKLQATLALRDAGAMAGLTVEQLLEKIQSSRARSKNLSYFAFTATPKHSTLMLFGRPADPTQPASKDNLPVSFHKYPMRQAIEEGFILDVLQGYLPYKTAFNLAEPQEEGHRVGSRSGRRALAKWFAVHPTNVTQKVEFIVEHFAANVAPLLNGTAKAMVVTSSRAAAVRYKRGLDAYIAAHPEYHSIRALVAFSGSLTGKEVAHPADDSFAADDPFAAADDEQFSEASMNPSQYGSDLRRVFDRPEFRVMIVANKFQTGFDQPKLCALYLDKKIANPVEIVQTLSRLNRVAPGKDATFIIDFVNDPASVLEAFAKYDAGAHIVSVQNPDVVYDLQAELDKAGIYTAEDIENFKAVRFKSAAAYAQREEAQHKALYAATSAPAERFNDLLVAARAAVNKAEAEFETAKAKGSAAGEKAADARRSDAAGQVQRLLDFKSGVTRFGRLYTYIAQTIDFGDPGLEAFAGFARLLAKRLEGVPPEQVDVSGLVLTGFDIKPQEKPGATEADGDATILKPVGPGGVGEPSPPVYLRQLIARLNSIFGEATPLVDKVAFVNHVNDIVREDANTMAQVERNPREVAMRGSIRGSVQRAVVRAMQTHSDLAEHVLKEDQQAMAPLVALVYEMLKSGKNIDQGLAAP